MKHEYYMARALELAERALGKTNPNPLVGCVIVKDDKIIAEGFHQKLGGPHAEIEALMASKESVQGATMYVALEPCSHYGRTPPCAKAIIEAGIKKVVIAMIDPNPKVSGNGIKMLKNAGIEVITGVLEDKAKKLNEIFVTYITKQRPFVILKSAMTLDGKIASQTGDSKWITNEASRNYVHKLRNRVSAVMVGINTVLADNPFLTTRLENGGRDAARIIVDSSGRIPENSNVINTTSNAPTILATTSKIAPEKEKILETKGIKIIKAADEKGTVNIIQVFKELHRMEIDSILVEGGGALNSSMLLNNLVDKVMFFIAPKIIGGKTAKTPVEGIGIQNIKDAIQLKNIDIISFENDIMIEGYVCSQE